MWAISPPPPPPTARVRRSPWTHTAQVVKNNGHCHKADYEARPSASGSLPEQKCPLEGTGKLQGIDTLSAVMTVFLPKTSLLHFLPLTNTKKALGDLSTLRAHGYWGRFIAHSYCLLLMLVLQPRAIIPSYTISLTAIPDHLPYGWLVETIKSELWTTLTAAARS